jgi:hypothetical protein
LIPLGIHQILYLPLSFEQPTVSLEPVVEEGVVLAPPAPGQADVQPSWWLVIRMRLGLFQVIQKQLLVALEQAAAVPTVSFGPEGKRRE